MAELRHSAHGKKDWSFDYSDITAATGLSYDVIVQHVFRKKVDMTKFESVLLYMAKHARPDLRLALLDAALRRDSAEYAPGTLKNEKAKAKPARRAKPS